MEECEVDEPRASPLDEVSCIEDEELQSLTTTLDPSGRIIVTKKRAKGHLPEDPEQLRMKLRVECNVWLMMAAKFGNRRWLQGLTPQDFTKFVDYFLGKRVYSLEVPCTKDGGQATEPLRPPWQVMLRYELECRKLAFRRVREEGSTLADALKFAISDAELRELHFVSPIALMGTKRAYQDGDWPPKKKWLKDKGKGAKGEGKGAKGKSAKGKGKGSKGEGKNSKLVSSTPDGRQICFGYNSEKGCSVTSCSRVHCCRYKACLGEHSMLGCNRHKAGA